MYQHLFITKREENLGMATDFYLDESLRGFTFRNMVSIFLNSDGFLKLIMSSN